VVVASVVVEEVVNASTCLVDVKMVASIKCINNNDIK